MIAKHVLAIALIGGFLALGWWQVSRASAGNTLSWAYAIEWPVFAGFVGFIWFREAKEAVRGAPRERAKAGDPDVAAAPPAPIPVQPPVLGTKAPKIGSGFRRPVLVPRRAAVAASAPAPDPALDEYNDYLAWLNANPGAKASQYPGRRRGPA
jgi:hypothetical protein